MSVLFPDLVFTVELSLERNHLLNGIKSKVPIERHTMPAGRKEKNESRSNPALARVSSITRLGGVPIRVIIPPMLLANANGMRNRDVLIPALLAMLTTIGSIRATVPVLLTNAPITEVTPITSKNNFNSLFPASLSNRAPVIFASPVWNIAPPTTNSPIIIITIELENPDNDSSVERMPDIDNVMRAISATTSERILPHAKNVAANMSVRIVINI